MVSSNGAASRLPTLPSRHASPTSSSSAHRCTTFTLVTVKSGCTRAVKGPGAGQGADLVLATDVLSAGGCRGEAGRETEEELSSGLGGVRFHNHNQPGPKLWLLLPVRLVVVVVELVVLT